MNLQGDPAIKIFPSSKPDYTWDTGSLKFSDPKGNKLTAWADSIHLEITLLNTARYQDENIPISVLRIKNNKIILESKSVANPVKVRYAWRNMTQANLFNKENLPASSFIVE